MIKFTYIPNYEQSKVLKPFITNNYNPTRVLFTTFWNLTDEQFLENLTRNVLDRYRNISMADLSRAQVLTFSSFVERAVRDHSSLLGLSSDFKVISEAEIKAKLHQLYKYSKTFEGGELFRKELDSIVSQGCDDVVDLTMLCVNRTFTKEQILESRAGSLQLVSKLFEKAEPDNSKNNIDWEPVICEQKALDSYRRFSSSMNEVDDRLEVLEKISSRIFREMAYSPERRSLHRAFLRHAGVNDPLLRQLHAELGKYLAEASDDVYNGFEYLLDQYHEYKENENVLDYYDLLECFDKLLDDENVRKELEDNIDHVFIYGFQASNDMEAELMSRMEEISGNPANKECQKTGKRHEAAALDEWRPKNRANIKKEFYSWFWNELHNLMIEERLEYSDIAIYMKDTINGDELFDIFNGHDVPYYTEKRSFLANDEIILLLGPLAEYEIQANLEDAVDDYDCPCELLQSYRMYQEYCRILEVERLQDLSCWDWGLVEGQPLSERLHRVYSILSNEDVLASCADSVSNRENNIGVLFKLLERFLSENVGSSLEEFLLFLNSWSDLSEFYSEYDAVRILNLSAERPMDCKYVFYLESEESRYHALHTGMKMFRYRDRKGLYVLPVPHSLAWLLNYCIDQILKNQEISFITDRCSQQARRILVLNKSQEKQWRKEPWHEGMPLYKKYI